MSEYIYYSKERVEFPLSESITVTNKLVGNSEIRYIVSNSEAINSEVVAKEIDFYIKNTKDSISSKIKNIEKLYEINAIKFDYAQDIAYTQIVGNKVLLICSETQKNDFINRVVNNEFDLYHVSSEKIKNIAGHIGNLEVTIEEEEKEYTLNIHQIVWFDKGKLAKKFSGCFDPLKSSIDDVIGNLRLNITNYEYKKTTTYDSSFCQYKGRREEICTKCVDVCTTDSIVKNSQKKELEFSYINCANCGSCVSVCPSGAIDYAPLGEKSISSLAKLYNNHIPLIIPKKVDIENLNIELKESVLPLIIEAKNFFSEATLLTLLQESGSQLILYSKSFTKPAQDSIDLINEIYQRKYKKDAILTPSSKEDLELAIKNAQFIENSKYILNSLESNKKESFAIRLSHLVGEENFGEIKLDETASYGIVNIDENKCTLCASCVGACKMNALTANTKDNTLRFNPSLCTACGYCEVSCSEKDCLSLQRGVIKLEPMWFKENILAKDELFACVECGKEFATKKAIEKIASIMLNFFDNPTKQRTLYCCEECKPKVMFKDEVTRRQLV
ncbi:4Fe-4S binding protein [Halarcobacter ebronensis]|uniref:4Fe-4S ferredoxin n=1 Tax=Halarcobacter ebronensis TaxID=1462615 RepID=A0A4Q1AJS7_9BACT|nr:4Fe-4S binding protein [Halarcobacter ebronensis]QKF81794.1 [4Fe-4S] dicluster domain-containing protein [Halarcobacter ebronensis]RXK04534.1 4Fe-4S ferredoxin [Halarcobacter ebronensis]